MVRVTKLLVIAAGLVCLLSLSASAAQDDLILTRSDGFMFRLSGQNLTSLGYTYLGAPLTGTLMKSNGDVIAARNDGVVYLLSGNDLGYMNHAIWGTTLKKLALKPNDDFIAVNTANTIYCGYGSSASPTGAWNNLGTSIDNIAVLSTGDVIASFGNGYVGTFDGTSLVHTGWTSWASTMVSLVVGPGDKVAMTNTANTNYLVTGDGSTMLGYANFGQSVPFLGFQPDGDVVVTLSGGDSIQMSGTDMSMISEWWPGEPVVKTAMRPDGSLVVVNAAGTAFAVDANMGYSGTFLPGLGTVTCMVAQSDGDIVLTNQAGSLYLLDGSTLAVKAAIGSGYEGMVNIDIQRAVPEPGSLMALASGLIALAGSALRRRG